MGIVLPTKKIKAERVNPKRLIFGERLGREEYLARYRVADLFLDTTEALGH